ncbi:MAG: hypothetical protein L0G94_16650 [Brachybacterium sp.]|uniref:hypothetical protein n=1 Tax=Brachybacterium sp. TaxID=1891286 RepID=UPI0026470BB1|nr:hypothetical protein [Brachybacterium sp.]MDN5688287.1 hypothetical protein [Brachybacterium sp.]
MSSTPLNHPDDETRPVAEDQGEGPYTERGPDDLVDEQTKRLSEEEAQQHDDVAEAQRTDAEESGGYGP